MLHFQLGRGEWAKNEVMAVSRRLLRGAEAGIGLCAAGARLGGRAWGGGAGDGVAGASAVLQGLLCDHLLQGVLLLYFEDVGLLS
jgi:hypothetical protein